MKYVFTFKLVLIALLMIFCSTAKAKIVEFETGKLKYSLDTEAQKATLTGYTGQAKDVKEVVVPETVTYEGKEYEVIRLGDKCFSNCYSLTSITIPSSVTSLGNGCFTFCESLTSIKIPSSVTSLGDGCFSHCISLTSITIPSSVTSLGDYCFAYSDLTSITIPSSVTSLGDGCFCECFSLTSIDIPSSVIRLGNSCFGDCI